MLETISGDHLGLPLVCTLQPCDISGDRRSYISRLRTMARHPRSGAQEADLCGPSPRALPRGLQSRIDSGGGVAKFPDKHVGRQSWPRPVHSSCVLLCVTLIYSHSGSRALSLLRSGERLHIYIGVVGFRDEYKDSSPMEWGI